MQSAKYLQAPQSLQATFFSYHVEIKLIKENEAKTWPKAVLQTKRVRITMFANCQVSAVNDACSSTQCCVFTVPKAQHIT